MVGKMPPPGLCSCSTDRHRSVDVKTVNQLRISATRHDPKGLDVRELPLLQRKEKCFLLTSPFIEPATWLCSRRLRDRLHVADAPGNPDSGQYRGQATDANACL